MKNFDPPLANLWLGVALLVFAAINAIQGERNVTALLIIGLCNIAIGAAARRGRANG